MSTLGNMILYDVSSNRPAASIPGRLFFATDTGVLYRDSGSVWNVYSSFFGSGNTGARPTLDSTAVGCYFFDTDIGKPIWWAPGLVWIDAAGNTV